MDPLKLYEISEEYIAYLRSFDRLVFSAKEEDRIHTRKYLGIVHTINNYDYYIPLSSPKKIPIIRSLMGKGRSAGVSFQLFGSPPFQTLGNRN